MALTHRIVNSRFIQGYDVQGLAEKYHVPTTTIESIIRKQLRSDAYCAPTQDPISFPCDQMSISEVYGEIEV